MTRRRRAYQLFKKKQAALLAAAAGKPVTKLDEVETHSTDAPDVTQEISRAQQGEEMQSQPREPSPPCGEKPDQGQRADSPRPESPRSPPLERQGATSEPYEDTKGDLDGKTPPNGARASKKLIKELYKITFNSIPEEHHREFRDTFFQWQMQKIRRRSPTPFTIRGFGK